MRQTLHLAASLAVALALALPLPAQAGEPVVANAPARERALADRLSTLLNSEATIIGDVKSDAKAHEFALGLFGNNEEVAALEAEYPGIMAEFLDAVMPIVNNSMRVRLPELQRRQSDLYVETFDEADLAFLVRFYESPTGRKLVALTMDNLRTDNMARAAQSSGDLTISPDAVVADLRSTAQAITPQFDDSDMPMLIELGSSPVAPKMQAMALRTQQIGLEWQDEYLPGEEEEIEALIESIIARRMEAME
ncbi:MAG TPA: DUF2059 domain-containing protein [Sphingopyxis sp.]|nr:DUF2059 domain-containing protein [Sphingopyxis sp.]HMP45806.1 DUF2059 domain-containing protein [Sphingopyxis sp.]HMQ19020.1 DUF2059 domain-containing protein [Sphingopyxis sp.]